MVTLVGTQDNFEDALKALVELDYDTIEAYEAALNRVGAENLKTKLTEFKTDHQRHIGKISTILRNHSIEPPTGPSMGKQWITKGKVVIANLLGDKALLTAMRSNEIDTNAAYERMHVRNDLWPETIPVLNAGLEDEKRHKAWLEAAAAAM